MTDQFSRDHYRDSRQPGENSSRRRIDANPNHRTAGNDARHASSSRRPAGTRQQTSTHQQGAPRPRSASQAGREPAPHRTPSQNHRQQMRQGAPSRNHASSSANRPAAQGNVRPASYNRSRAQANRNNPANAAVYNDYSRYTERRSKRPGPVAIGVMAVLIIAIGIGVFFVLNPPNQICSLQQEPGKMM